MRTRGTGPKLEDKLKSLASLSKIVRRLKRKGKRVVFTNGCFDILHYGHARYLQEAKRLGDILIVAINSDSSVRRIKGKNRPVIDEKNRSRLIAALESVDFVTIFGEPTPLKVIARLKPDIIVKGADWEENAIVGSDIVKGYGGRVLRVALVKGLSTTNLIRKIVKKHN